MTETNETALNADGIPVIARPEELGYDLAYASHANTSFTPEKRAKSEQQAFADDVNGFYADMLKLCTNEEQRGMIDAEILRYKENYLERYGAYLQSHSRVASSMITGPANFPVARNQKYGRWADNKFTEFKDWRTRAQDAIKSKILAARTGEEKEDAAWTALRSDMERSLKIIEGIDEGTQPWDRSAFVTSIVGKVERLANNGETGIVEKALAFVTSYNEQHEKPAISHINKFWTFNDLAKANAARLAAPAPDAEVLHQADGIQVIANHEADRVQIVFDAIPPAETRSEMKSSGWHWSQREGAWQRKLTEAAKYSAKKIIGF